jgi:uncharacterized protein YutD
MSKLSTFNYLVNSFYAGKKEVEILQINGFPSDNFDTNSIDSLFEPSQSSINAILNFASQYEVLKSARTGNIELNLN